MTDKERIKNVVKILFFRRTLSDETDRGLSLMAASFLENEIAELIRAKLVGSKKSKEALFDYNGPLGTFSSKIKLAYSIGLISKITMDDLEIIRRIRNKFGHEYAPITFESNEIKSEIVKLKSNYYNENDKKTIRPRGILTNSVLGILVDVSLANETEKPFKEKLGSKKDDSEYKEYIKNSSIKEFERLKEKYGAEINTPETRDEIFENMIKGVEKVYSNSENDESIQGPSIGDKK